MYLRDLLGLDDLYNRLLSVNLSSSLGKKPFLKQKLYKTVRLGLINLIPVFKFTLVRCRHTYTAKTRHTGGFLTN
jgi:hypothetical protein